jgi:predicted Zn-dependent peptidase
MSGVSAKQANQENKDENEIDNNIEEINTDKSLSEELEKLNTLKESGVLTQEEFEKAKNKLLNN